MTMLALRIISLYGNELTGSIPESLGDLIHLQHLDLSTNQLSGQLPQSMSKLVNLRQLHLETNSFTGPWVRPEGSRRGAAGLGGGCPGRIWPEAC